MTDQRRKVFDAQQQRCSPVRAGSYIFLHNLSDKNVRLALDEKTQHKVVVKVLRKDMGHNNVSDGHCTGQMKREGKIHSQLAHKHILPLIEVINDVDRICIVTALAEGGDLQSYMRKRQQTGSEGLPLDEARRIFLQLVEAVNYLHNRGFVHRDIKPENVFLDASGNVLLGDFGLSCSWKEGNRKTRSCGTTGYIAPCLLVETCSYEGPELDCWGLGACLYFLLHGRDPFAASSDLKVLKKTRSGRYNWTRHEEVEGAELVARLPDVNSKKRATLKEVLAHPFCTTPAQPNTTPATISTSLPVVGVKAKREESRPTKKSPRTHKKARRSYVSPLPFITE